jgi:hypothetical protein
MKAYKSISRALAAATADDVVLHIAGNTDALYVVIPRYQEASVAVYATSVTASGEKRQTKTSMNLH